jgi:hypothetical protein
LHQSINKIDADEQILISQLLGTDELYPTFWVDGEGDSTRHPGAEGTDDD